jgi:hypothetical protein
MVDLVAAMLWMVVELVLVVTGRCIVVPASLGRWRAERLDGRESRIHSPAGAFSFRLDGRRVITANGLLVVGVLFYLVLACGVGWAVH